MFAFIVYHGLLTNGEKNKREKKEMVLGEGPG
jgi:hypothetical protein